MIQGQADLGMLRADLPGIKEPEHHVPGPVLSIPMQKLFGSGLVSAVSASCNPQSPEPTVGMTAGNQLNARDWPSIVQKYWRRKPTDHFVRDNRLITHETSAQSVFVTGLDPQLTQRLTHRLATAIGGRPGTPGTNWCLDNAGPVAAPAGAGLEPRGNGEPPWTRRHHGDPQLGIRRIMSLGTRQPPAGQDAGPRLAPIRQAPRFAESSPTVVARNAVDLNSSLAYSGQAGRCRPLDFHRTRIKLG